MKSQKIRRYELKYFISKLDYERYKLIFPKIMKQDSYQKNDNGYLVRSLYFDDEQDTSLTEKLSGIENRDKYRLRIYSPNQSWAKLERKRKINQYMIKDSYRLNKTEISQILSRDYSPLFKSSQNQARMLGLDFIKKSLKPVTLIDYIRNAFTLDYNQIRITFDTNLKTHGKKYDLFTKNNPTINALRDDLIIMEIKYNHFLPLWLSKIIKTESPARSAISKYTYGRLQAPESAILNYLI